MVAIVPANCPKILTHTTEEGKYIGSFVF